MACRYYFKGKQLTVAQLAKVVADFADVNFQKITDVGVIVNTIQKRFEGYELREWHNGQRDHTYTHYGKPVGYNSMSTRVDPFAPFGGVSREVTDDGFSAAEQGTIVHRVFEDYILGNPVDGKGLTPEFIQSAKDWVDSMRAKGYTLMPELVVVDHDNKTCGSVDVFAISPSGVIEIYDFKTTNLTPKKAKMLADGKRSANWSIMDYAGYKARRYAAQLEGYKAILEKEFPDFTFGGTFVIPIEVCKSDDFKDLSDDQIAALEAKGIPTSTAQIMMQPQDTRQWNFYKEAKLFVDKEFGRINHLIDTTTTEVLTTIVGTDVVDNTAVHKRNAEYKAKNPILHEGKLGFKAQNGNFVPFNSTDFETMVQQVMTTFASEEYANSAIAGSIEQYFQGKATLDDMPNVSRDMMVSIQKLKAVYSSNATFEKISDISPAFGDFSNVIKVTDNGRTELIVIENNLTHKFGKDHLLGEHMTKHQAKKAGVLFDDTKQGVSDLRMGILVALLNDNIDNLQIDRIITMDAARNSNNVTFPSMLIPKVASVMNSPKIKALLTPEQQALFDESVYNESKIRQNHVAVIANTLAQYKKDNNVVAYNMGKTIDVLDIYMENQEGKEEVINQLREMLRAIMTEHTRLGKNAEYTRQDPVVRGISHALVQLTHHTDIRSAEDITSPNKYTATMTMSGNTMADAVGRRLTTANEVWRNKYHEYIETKKKVHKDLAEDYYKHNGGKLSHKTIGDESVIYKELIKKHTDADGRQYYTMEFYTKNDPEWSSLRPAQKAYIEWYQKKTIELFGNLNTKKGMENINDGSTWKSNMIPVFSTHSFADKLRATKNFKEFKEAARAELEQTLTFFETNNGFSDSRVLSNAFSEQTGNTEFGGSRRRNALGLNDFQTSGTINYDKQGQIEFNLENVLDLLAAESLRVEVMKPVLADVKAAEAVAKANEEILGEGAARNVVDFMVIHGDANVHNKGQKSDDPTIRMIEIGISKGTSVMMHNLIGFNVFSALKTTIQSGTSGFLSSLANQFAGVENQQFKASDVMAAFTEVMNPSNLKKISRLTVAHHFTRSDVSELMQRHSVTDSRTSSVGNLAFSLHQLGDDFVRAVYMVAQLKADGLWDAYTMTTDANGNEVLSFDEDKAQAFKEGFRGRTAEQAKAYKEAIKNDLAKEGRLSGDNTTEWKDRKMLVGYSHHLEMRNKMMFDQMFEGTSKETNTAAQHHAIYKIGFSLKRYLIKNKQKYYHERQDFIGSKFTDYRMATDSEGNISYEKYIGQHEGILQSVVHAINEVQELYAAKKKGESYTMEFDEVQKDNYRRLLADITMAALVTLAASMMFDDDDDEKAKLSRKLLQASVEEAWMPITPSFWLGAMSEPMVLMSFMKDIATNIENLATSDSFGEAAHAIGSINAGYRTIETGINLATDD